MYAVNSKDPAAYIRQMEQIFPVYFAVCAMAAMGLTILSPDVIAILTPAAYHRAGSLVALIATAYLLAQLSNYFIQTFFIHHKMSQVVYAYVAAAIVNLSANLILVKKFGIIGAALGAILAYGVMLVSIYWFSNRLVPIKILSNSVFIIAIFLASATVLLHSWLVHPVYLSLMVKTPILFTLCFFVGWYLQFRRKKFTEIT